MIEALSTQAERNRTTQLDISKQDAGVYCTRLVGVTIPVYDLSLKNIIVPRLRRLASAANRKSGLVLLVTFLVLIGAAISVYVLQPQFYQLHSYRINSGWGLTIIGVSVLLLAFRVFFFLYQLFQYLRYRPVASVADDLLPSCTVIVPAFNEGEQVWHTLMSLAMSDYPVDRLQLIAIDDGSQDDTWLWMQRAKATLGDRLEIFQQPENMGKRQALYRGFHLGRGSVFVTVDSDSVVKADTLRNLVSPFVTNKKCGAVAGNVQVLNNDKAIIPKMLNVSFVFSFEFVRSAESMLGSVLCTPGALAAYRREAVFACLPEWINQTFMGQPSDIGEDRAMTNMILKQGYVTLFQQNACVLTKVPEQYRGLYKMFIRWGRSNVRENIMMGNFVFRRFRVGATSGTRLLFLNQWIKIVMAYPALLLMTLFVLLHPVLFFSSTLFSILVLASIPVLFYAKRYGFSTSVWAYSYGILYAFGLFWITPYAIATAARRGWLTRGCS